MDDLEVGKRYSIVFQIKGLHRKSREAVMTYVGKSGNGKEVYFSARPLAGTQTLEVDWIISVTQVADDARIKIPR